MPSAHLAIAIDIGGTSAKLALVQSPGRMLSRAVIPTHRQMTPAVLLQDIVLAVRQLRADARRRGALVVGIGVGVPGLVDAHRGVVRYLVNMPRWRQVPLARRIAQATRMPTIVENDVNAMAWGEYRWGAGRGAASLLCVMLGTGVGGGLVLNGRLYRGWTMSAGEIGHAPLGWRGPSCACGGRACLEQYTGKRAVVMLARRLARRRPSLLRKLSGGDLRAITPPMIDRAAYRGDAVAREVWRRTGEAIGLALTSVVNVVNPERILIGGGIANAGPLLFPTIRATVKARAMRGPSAVRIVRARYGEDAGLIGAAAMVLAPEPDGRTLI